MAQLKILGSQGSVKLWLRAWPEIKPRGGHTVVEYEVGTQSEKTAAEIFSKLTTLYKFTALDMTVADAPKRIKSFPTTEADVVLIPQIAGGS